MGCNFYLPDGTHVGKRSAAGLYCWDCGITLCAGGESRVHYSDSDGDWYDECPRCGAKPEAERLENSSAGRELGFNKQPLGQRKTGVASCSSFTWAIPPYKLFTGRGWIADEYERKYTPKQFRAILDECPIQYYDSIGQEFC